MQSVVAKKLRERPGSPCVCSAAIARNTPTAGSCAISSTSGLRRGRALAARSPAGLGTYNLGTGRARSWLDLAHALVCGAGRPPVDRVHRHAGAAAREIPVFHRSAYASLCAVAGYKRAFTSLEDGIGITCVIIWPQTIPIVSTGAPDKELAPMLDANRNTDPALADVDAFPALAARTRRASRDLRGDRADARDPFTASLSLLESAVYARAARLCCSATAAAPPMRSTSPPSS
jgi:hypothetical protein